MFLSVLFPLKYVCMPYLLQMFFNIFTQSMRVRYDYMPSCSIKLFCVFVVVSHIVLGLFVMKFMCFILSKGAGHLCLVRTSLRWCCFVLSGLV